MKFAASELIDVSESELALIADYEKFIELAGMEYDRDTEKKLSALKAEAFANIPDNKSVHNENISVEKTEKSHSDTSANNTNKSDTFVVNSPEKVSVSQNKARYKANIEAIKTLQKIEAENRFATAEEQAVMAKYVGWGGIQQAFINDRAAESISGKLNAALNAYKFLYASQCCGRYLSGAFTIWI